MNSIKMYRTSFVLDCFFSCWIVEKIIQAQNSIMCIKFSSIFCICVFEAFSLFFFSFNISYFFFLFIFLVVVLIKMPHTYFSALNMTHKKNIHKNCGRQKDKKTTRKKNENGEKILHTPIRYYFLEKENKLNCKS